MTSVVHCDNVQNYTLLWYSLTQSSSKNKSHNKTIFGHFGISLMVPSVLGPNCLRSEVSVGLHYEYTFAHPYRVVACFTKLSGININEKV